MWYNEYLLSLREYSRDLFQSEWTNRVRTGDVVLIKSPIKTRAHWQLGEVVSLFPGEDNKIRSVKIRKGDGREDHYPINFLYPLELSITHSGSTRTDKSDINDSVNLDNRPKRQAAEVASDRIRLCLTESD